MSSPNYINPGEAARQPEQPGLYVVRNDPTYLKVLEELKLLGLSLDAPNIDEAVLFMESRGFYYDDEDPADQKPVPSEPDYIPIAPFRPSYNDMVYRMGAGRTAIIELVEMSLPPIPSLTDPNRIGDFDGRKL